MTSVLYWNVNNFSMGKIRRPDPPYASVMAQDRLNHVVHQVVAPNPPDIFVIVEVFGRIREVGYQGVVLRPGSNAGLAVGVMLDELRDNLSPYWCAVPPLNVGDFGFREAVAVFYNAQTLQFTGPYAWTLPNALSFNRARPAPAPGDLGRLCDYEDDWEEALPGPNNRDPNLQGVRTWNTAAGAAIPEAQSAAQWEFYSAGAQRLNWPGAQNRSPYYARFRETGGANRTIKLFAVHTSPASADAAVNTLDEIVEVAPGANEVSLVIGDFNVDSFDMNHNGAYRPIMNTHEMLLDPRNTAGHVDARRKPYCMTHLLPVDLARPFNDTGVPTGPQHNVYPRYGYMGSVTISPRAANDSGAIDNAFVAYGGGLVAPANFNTSIVNTVVGKPYAANPNIHAELTGGAAYAQTLADPIPAGGQDPPMDAIFFDDWTNYGRVYSTSDHLALRVTV